jgi:hypothetical protein
VRGSPGLRPPRGVPSPKWCGSTGSSPTRCAHLRRSRTLTPDEQQRILDTIEKAKTARNESGLEELRAALADMEKAATIIGQAMLKP